VRLEVLENSAVTLAEVTAVAVEATAEALVRDVLAPAEDRTVLLITHRPEGLDLVDEVVRLDGCVGGEHARRPQSRAL
jgi:ATP-binding cassette subfamily C protein CydCD